MGNFEKLSVLVIVVIIVMILVVALYTWTGDGSSTDVATKDGPAKTTELVKVVEKPNVFPIPTTPTPSPSALPPLPPLVKSDAGPSMIVPPLPGSGAAATPPTIEKKPVVERAEKSYEVASGDNATKIVKREMTGTSLRAGLSALEKANPGIDLNTLRVGQKLVIPGRSGELETASMPSGAKDDVKGVAKETTKASGLEPGSLYVTHRGDTLPAISKRTYGTTDRWHEIWLANYASLEDPSMLPAGTRLRLPN